MIMIWVQLGHMIGSDVSLDTSLDYQFQNKIKMANGLNLSFFYFFTTNITGLSYNMCPKSVLKLILWINAHIFQAKRLHSEYIFNILFLKW